MNGWICAALSLCLAAGCAPLHSANVQGDGVTLTLRAPEAREVRLLASYDRFTPRRAVRDKEGIWSAAGLPNVDFNYFYLVDGKAVTPDCRFKASDDLGSTNCRHIPKINH